MTVLVADTSGLVSLGTTADQTTDLVALSLTAYEVQVPETVVAELRETASYDDEHGRAAQAVLDHTDEVAVQSVSLDADFPLDDGENATVTLANDVDAALCLCDEFNRLGLIHASLANTRLVTTPTLLSVLARNQRLSETETLALLDRISQARSWEANSYVERARSRIDSA
jgi:predicted nucleic acid-binding protein